MTPFLFTLAHISLPSDNVNMLKIIGMKNGRIFMAGSDGSLYELYYQADDGWFSKKARKINHSQSYLGSFVSFLKYVWPHRILSNLTLRAPRLKV